jgi:hypothetical protein
MPASFLVGELLRAPIKLVANRCLAEPASRALDAAIYCAVLGTADANTLTSAPLIEARARGMILVNQAAIKGWVDAPPYTEDISSAACPSA